MKVTCILRGILSGIDYDCVSGIFHLERFGLYRMLYINSLRDGCSGSVL